MRTVKTPDCHLQHQAFFLYKRTEAFEEEKRLIGIQSVKKEQILATYGLSLSYTQMISYIVLLLAVRNTLLVLLTQKIITPTWSMSLTETVSLVQLPRSLNVTDSSF